jgi:hypothetical protein
MTTITVELSEDGTGTISIDGSEPVPFQGVEQVCTAIETLAGQPDEDEAAAFGGATTEETQPPMRQAPAKPQMGARMGGM